jgi:hypothetical protein
MESCAVGKGVGVIRLRVREEGGGGTADGRALVSSSGSIVITGAMAQGACGLRVEGGRYVRSRVIVSSDSDGCVSRIPV